MKLAAMNHSELESLGTRADIIAERLIHGASKGEKGVKFFDCYDRLFPVVMENLLKE